MGQLTSPDIQRNELKTAAIFGLLIATAINLGWHFTLWLQMGANFWCWPIAILTCHIQTVVTVYGLILATRLHRHLIIDPWLAIPFGAVAGALVGAISIGLTIGVRSVLGIQSGMIEMLREAAFLNEASAFQQFLEGAAAGATFGAVGGFIPEAVGSLALSLWRKVRARRSN
ncbi:MAG TPA: hypothetical protein VLR89_10635 [Anaerolineaceae bacterium]|nr:hypothetical protein [Anaerolineaceae bacterium]